MKTDRILTSELGALCQHLDAVRQREGLRCIALVGAAPRAGVTTVVAQLTLALRASGVAVTSAAAQPADGIEGLFDGASTPSSSVLRERFAQLSGDLILVDAGSVNQPQALALAATAQASVLVVPADSLPAPAVRHAADRLRGGGATVIGAILNRRRLRLPGFLYRLL